MDDLVLRTATEAAAVTDVAATETPAGRLQNREALLASLQGARQKAANEGEAFLVVINIADTKAYDEIIRIFGYSFADNMLDIRLAALEVQTGHLALHRVGFWSIGFLYVPARRERPGHFFATLAEQLREPMICRGIPIPIRAGIGVCDLFKGAGSTEDLLQATFMAGQASSLSGQSFTLCNPDITQDHRRAFMLIADLGDSLAAQTAFELNFQPRLDLRTGKCTSAEALLRWRHPQLGPVAPGEFIPIAEMTGLMRALTDWVVARAAAQTVDWHRKGMALNVSVNISVRNLDEPDFVERLSALIGKYGLPPKCLELELSEQRGFMNPALAKAQLAALRALGVRIAIDDFGTGPNSLDDLETSPADIMKINQSLTRAMKDRPRSRAIVKSLIAMAHELGMQVAAEGVEDRDSAGQLAAWKCDFAQGFLFSRPLPAAAFEAWYLAN
jgi:EAL domain-containing protein (putative c-di-GMP-specific phosphodiesterase class I)